MAPTASVLELAAEAPWSFLIGAIVGFVVGTRFNLTRRDDGEPVELPPPVPLPPSTSRRRRRRRGP